MMKIDITGKVAMVTGGNGAIGGAAVLRFADCGADVIIHGQNEERGARVKKLAEEKGVKAVFIKADLSDPDDAMALPEKALAAFGKVDILVNNAGTNVSADGRRPIYEFSEDEWNHIIDTDLKSILYISKPIIKNMMENKYGKIINIGSVAGVTPLRNQCAFVAAKAGLHELTRAMAIELAPYNILVNAIAPGSIMMEGTKAHFYSKPDVAESLLSHVPLHRPGEPDEIASVIVFMASDYASYLTGAVLPVDGGWTCGYNREW